MSGTLYLCATPIGNLEDITLRVLRILKEVDLIAAEDTRHTKKLLNHYEINTPLSSYHEHNKYTKGPALINKLKQGMNIALVTDAGTPGISDPGEDLVRLCHENEISITAAPGAVAATTGLILSGLPTRRFSFEGFLPSDKNERKTILGLLQGETRSIILYEAPHRLRETLKTLFEYLGDRTIVLTRELTKKYEEIQRTGLEKAIAFYEQEEPKGEYVLIIEGKAIEEIMQEEIRQWKQWSIEDHMELYIGKGLSHKDAMKQVAKDRGVSKREIYSYIHKDT